MKFVNSKGVTWYSHLKQVTIGRNKALVNNYYFKKEKDENAVEEIPSKYTVIELPNGLPIIKRK